MLTTITEESANIFDVAQTFFYRRAYSIQIIQETTIGFYLGEYNEKAQHLSESLGLMKFILAVPNLPHKELTEKSETDPEVPPDYTKFMIESLFSKSCANRKPCNQSISHPTKGDYCLDCAVKYAAYIIMDICNAYQIITEPNEAIIDSHPKQLLMALEQIENNTRDSGFEIKKGVRRNLFNVISYYIDFRLTSQTIRRRFFLSRNALGPSFSSKPDV